jgi:DNA invertase Pin-like site-specific DNA recombinase
VICAAYLRKSNPDEGKPDEFRSIERQKAACLAFAETRGWRVGHVFEDDGIGGAEFDRRPGLVRLLNALNPRPPFDALVVYDRDRLGREAIEVPYVIKQLIRSGVRVWEVKGGGREVTLDNPTDKVLLAVTASPARSSASRRGRARPTPCSPRRRRGTAWAASASATTTSGSRRGTSCASSTTPKRRSSAGSSSNTPAATACAESCIA